MTFTGPELVLAALAGASVGMISGVFGIGGGFLVVPVLNIILGVPMEYAVGAGVCQVLGPATTSLLARRVGPKHFRLPLTITGGLLFGVVSGAEVLESTADYGAISISSRAVPLTDLVVLSVYFVILLGVGLFALWEVQRTRDDRPPRRGWIAGWKLPPCAELPEFEDNIVSIPALAWFGLAVGFISGLLGMSGGLLLLPGLIYLLGLKTHKAVMSSLAIVWLIAAQGTIAHAWNGHVDLTLVGALLFGGTIGARIGSELGTRIGGPQLRQAFGWLLLTTAILIAARLANLILP